MRTYSHGLIGWLLYLKGTSSQRRLAVAGAVMPDVFLAIGFLFHFTGNSAASEILHDFFHHSPVHDIVTVGMHSFLTVIPLLLLAHVAHRKAVPFFVGMLSHVIVDLLTHQRGGYNHFFPLDIPQFPSPVSYVSTWFTVLEHVLFMGVLAWIWTRRRSK